MVDNKKVAAGVAAVALIGTAAVLALRGDEEPVEEGAPQGEVSIEVTPLGSQGFTFDDVQGAWGVGAVINVNGVCTAGYPEPSMLLELIDDGVVIGTITIPSVVIGQTYKVSKTMGSADIGGHAVHGRMVLANPLGDWQFTSDPVNFDIGVEPPGQVTIDVILQ